MVLLPIYVVRVEDLAKSCHNKILLHKKRKKGVTGLLDPKHYMLVLMVKQNSLNSGDISLFESLCTCCS